MPQKVRISITEFKVYYEHMRTLFLRYKIEQVTLEYDGSGDSGQVRMGDIQYMDARRPVYQAPGEMPEIEGEIPVQSWDPETRGWDEVWAIRKLRLDTVAEQIADQVINATVGGYENNEGGRGTITLSLDSIKVKHIEYYYDTDNSPENEEYYDSEVLESDPVTYMIDTPRTASECLVDSIEAQES